MGRLRSMGDRLWAGSLTPEEAQPRIASWVAHAKHANTRRLRRALFRGGSFGPPPAAVCKTWGAAGHASGTVSPTFVRSMTTEVRKRLTFASSKKSRRVSSWKSCMSRASTISAKSASPVM